jgi:endo-1,4-beta-xylanase
MTTPDSEHTSDKATGVSRRHILQMAAAGVAATHTGFAAAAPMQGLGTIAAANNYLFGAAAAEVIDNDPAYRDLYII